MIKLVISVLMIGLALTAAALSDHPRLLLTKERENEIKNNLNDSVARKYFQEIILSADKILDTPPVERKLVGSGLPRMLETSREAERRVILLGLAYRLGGDEKYLKRLIAELNAISEFPDWHPEHYLDTAEMTAALALGLDWSYDKLTEEQRQKFARAIIDKGLKTGLDEKNWWIKHRNNWNQVCHGGLVLGALAVYEYDPVTADNIIAQAKDNIHFGLAPYAPSGVYPEGLGYWGYGTSYSILLDAAVRSAGLAPWPQIWEQPGFAESFDYVLAMMTPAKLCFNYADGVPQASPIFFHFYYDYLHQLNKYHDAAVKTLWTRENALDNKGNYLMGLGLIWYRPELNKANPGSENEPYYGKSEVELAVLRAPGNYLGVKGGDVKVNHGHLDAGSFILEMGNTRWAVDLGAERAIYDRKDTWSLDQDSKRWDYLRANNLGHNLVSVDNSRMQVAKTNPLLLHRDSNTVVATLDSAYSNVAQKFRRTLQMNGDHAIVRDEFILKKIPAQITWRMYTLAQIKIDDSGRTAVLTIGKKELKARINAPENAVFSVLSGAGPRDDEDKNRNISVLAISYDADALEQTIDVVFDLTNAGR